MKLIIDSRMREEEKRYINKYGEIIEINPKLDVYEEISGHPDIFICKINDKVILSPNLKDDKYTDERVIETINKYNLNKIQVKQGYSNCSISVISENACITSDKRNL